ncbi:microfibrillar-associated protein 1-like [Senna tora]|uniref:Microfibrillar-associated protein 1-like n=1 Tax=Senna tora TaxID=362788 RepID=A0A834WJT6_9FABA|nr:microfibrillar-associated protein 1-like [Senna tora]
MSAMAMPFRKESLAIVIGGLSLAPSRASFREEKMMWVRGGVSESVIGMRDKLRGQIGQTKVKRYWPGKLPEWAHHDTQQADIIGILFPTPQDSEIVKDDRRLRRLAQSRIDNREDVRAHHRRIRQAEIVSTIEEEEDENALEERRRRIREKLLQRKEKEALAQEEEEEEELAGIIALVKLKPVFVPITQRDTIAERERLEAQERALEEATIRRMEERKTETKQIVVEEIRKDQEIHNNLELEANVADIETDDEVNEYEAWRVREIGRIKRKRDERETIFKYNKQEIPKHKWRFMQKYYHKGAFFQSNPDATLESDNIYTRDFSAPTGEDKIDKTILPKLMQVKHFGRSGRTEWTHLVNEDTTDSNNQKIAAQT